MRRFPAALLILALLAIAWQQYGSSGASAIEIEPVVWQFADDYPGANGDDPALNVKTVYIKTHDGTDWMSAYDGTSSAISGPDRLRQVIDDYRSRGVDVIAWFVPKTQDVERQVQMAEEVLDTGVSGLYADIEPFPGFCDVDCNFLASYFWTQLRIERPQARLGVIYDPRPVSWGDSAIWTWLASANVALPMCYWELFVDQPPWNDPAGCVQQASADLPYLAPGTGVEYVPMLQGDSSADKFLQALDASDGLGVKRVSVWRRGVMSPDVWTAALSRSQPGAPPLLAAPVAPLAPAPQPAVACTADGCLLQEASSPTVYVISAGAKFAVPNADTAAALGLNLGYVNFVPDGALGSIASIPPDGTLFHELGSDQVYVMAGGARFPIFSPDTITLLGNTSDIRTLPPGALEQIPTLPRDGIMLQEAGGSEQWQIAGGARFRIPDPASRDQLSAAGQLRESFLIPPYTVGQVPLQPRDGAHFLEVGGGGEWQIAGGAKFPLPATDVRGALVRSGQLEGAAYLVPQGSLAQVPASPRDRSLFREVNSEAVYQMAGGAKFKVTDPAALQTLIDSKQVETRIYLVPDGELSAVPDIPVNGTLLQGATSNLVRIISCGAITTVPDLPTLQSLMASGLTSSSVFVVSSGLSRFSAVPSEGCYLTGLANGAQYVMCEGRKWRLPSEATTREMFGSARPVLMPDRTLGLYVSANDLSACPDSDRDSFSDLAERVIGTDPSQSCGQTGWPPDVDGNGRVEDRDLAMIYAAAGSRQGNSHYSTRGDLNLDGVIDSADMDIVSAQLGKSCSP
ncbi:MAG: hypothetical protein E6J42_02365 [Chloroflexi bacterium]|nr:MAG: hypothetical protein E6J42_02365 [Chloroflexota bacterium]